MKKQFDLQYYLEHPETKVVTRDGHNARIICTDFIDPDYPVVALISRDNQTEFIECVTISGELHVEDNDDSDLFFDLPDPAKKKVALTYEDLLKRAEAGKTMWIIPDTNKYAKFIIGFDYKDCHIVDGLYRLNRYPTIIKLHLEEMMEYHFADGDPCWKEGGEE